MGSGKIFFNIARNCSNWSPVQRALLTKQNMVSQQIYTSYQDCLPKVIENALTHKKFDRLPEVKDRLKKITDYNIIGGKQLRGLLALFSYETLMKPQELTNEMWLEIFKLAWAIEMVQACLLISDDVDDDAETRRGQKCWHLLPDVGVFVINDVSILRSFIHEILKQNFGGRPQYPALIDLFNQTFLNTAMGQHLDSKFNYLKNPDSFTEKNYHQMSIYKTSHYTFRFPILLALIHSQKGNEKSYDIVDDICNEIGINLQIQNDFMDCFTNEDSMGKTGTDIPTGKLCWPAVEALKRFNPAQRKEFDSCYGKPDLSYVERVRNLYLELGLPQIYREQEQARYDMIMKKIKDLPSDAVPYPEVFLKALDLVYNKTQMVEYS